MRWALEPIGLQGGEAVAAGDKVVIDMMAANRDPDAYGPDADERPIRFALSVES